MTNEAIENIIDTLNKNKINEFVFISELPQNVDFAKVWMKEPQGRIVNERSYEFYLIKNELEIYIAAVLDMGNDLHIFVKKDSRKKGYLSRAINNVILPKLYQSGRNKQIITFIDHGMGEYVKKNWGFTLINNTSAEKDLSCYANIPRIIPKFKNITNDEFNLIKKNIDKARLYLTMVKEKIEASYGEDSNIYLDDLLDDIASLDDQIFDIIEERQGELVYS
jgi:hypothetical protein